LKFQSVTILTLPGLLNKHVRKSLDRLTNVCGYISRLLSRRVASRCGGGGGHALFGAVWFTTAINSIREWLFPVPGSNNNLEQALPWYCSRFC